MNEDSADVFPLAGTEAAWVVCDGMGGLRAGDVASQEAVRVVRETLQAGFDADSSAAPLPLLEQALKQANDAVNAIGGMAEEEPPTENAGAARGAATQPVMGTTCVAGLVRDDTLYLAHAGDSRAYHWRSGLLTRLTEDHSFVAERVRAGDMTEAEAKVSRFRNIVTRAIGIDKTVEPEAQSLPLETGDQIIVCSDGLTTVLEDGEIEQIINRPAHVKGAPDKLASALVDAANGKGGPDNITVLIVRAGEISGPVNGGQRSGTAAAQVINTNTPRPRPGKGGAPFTWLLLGLLGGLALAAALYALVPEVRAQASRLTGASASPRTVSQVTAADLGSQPAPDYGRLVYDPPRDFATRIAQGNMLSYSVGSGLYFLDGGTGKVAVLSKTGVPLSSVDKLPLPDKSNSALPTDFDVYMTSDPQGNVYFSYAKQKKVDKVAPDGRLLVTVRGFQKPEAVAVDEAGNLYVVDFNTIKICRARLPVGSGTPSAKPSAKASASPSPKPKATPSAAR